MTRVGCVLVLLLAGMGAGEVVGQTSVSVTPKQGWSFVSAGRIPIQSGGRIKPLDTFARETVLFLTGRSSYRGWNSVDLLLSWVTEPKYWENERLIVISRPDVRRQLLVGPTQPEQKYYSPAELFHNPVLLQYAASQQGRGDTVKKPGEARENPRDEELKNVLSRLGLFQTLLNGEALRMVPGEKTEDAWRGLTYHSGKVTLIEERFASMMKAYLDRDAAVFDLRAKDTVAAIEQSATEMKPGWKRTLQMEVFYNRYQLFGWACLLYLSAGFLWAMSALVRTIRKRKWMERGALVLTGVAGVAHLVGFTLRCLIAGRPPVSNMYESVIWVSLGILIFAAYLFYRQRQTVVMVVGCFMGGLFLLAADASPVVLDPGIHPLMPVLRSNFWLTVHVLTITLGYAAFAVTFGLGNWTLFHYLRAALKKRHPLDSQVTSLNQLTYRAMMIGVVLLAAGTLLGGVWADYSWGRFWGWDPKETWALIALLTYVAVLHGRYTGWVTPFGFAAWTVVCFISVLMAWYGVNFVLGAGLHSYGFSRGGLEYVTTLVVVQLLYVAVVSWMRRSRKLRR